MGASPIRGNQLMDTVEDLAAWVEQVDRDWQQWADGLEAEHQRLMAWLVEQSERDPLEGLH